MDRLKKEKEELRSLNSRLQNVAVHVQMLQEEKESLRKKIEDIQKPEEGSLEKVYLDQIRDLKGEIDQAEEKRKKVEEAVGRLEEETGRLHRQKQDLDVSARREEERESSLAQETDNLRRHVDFLQRLLNEQRAIDEKQVRQLRDSLDQLKKRGGGPSDPRFKEELETLDALFRNEKEILQQQHAQEIQSLRDIEARLETTRTNLGVDQMKKKEDLKKAEGTAKSLSDEHETLIFQTQKEKAQQDSKLHSLKQQAEGLDIEIDSIRQDSWKKDKEAQNKVDENISFEEEIKRFKAIITREESRFKIPGDKEEIVPSLPSSSPAVTAPTPPPATSVIPAPPSSVIPAPPRSGAEAGVLQEKPISSSSQPSSSTRERPAPSTPPAKRQRNIPPESPGFTIRSDLKSGIKIEEVDPEGKFILFSNVKAVFVFLL